jgi:hypothetical protein
LPDAVETTPGSRCSPAQPVSSNESEHCEEALFSEPDTPSGRVGKGRSSSTRRPIWRGTPRRMTEWLAAETRDQGPRSRTDPCSGRPLRSNSLHESQPPPQLPDPGPIDPFLEG